MIKKILHIFSLAFSLCSLSSANECQDSEIIEIIGGEETISLICENPLLDSNNEEAFASPSFSLLPDELFWKIIFDNPDNPLSQKDIHKLSLSSQFLYNRLEILFPKIILSRFPSVLQYLKTLSAFEKTEEFYQKLFSIYPNQVFYLDGYTKEVTRLLTATPYMRISPWCSLKSGTTRAYALARRHGIELQPESFKKFNCYISALSRDPLVFTSFFSLTSSICSFMGWKIHTNLMRYDYAYQENLNYTTTQQFIEDQMKISYVGAPRYFKAHHPSCFTTYNNPDIARACWNASTFCSKRGVDNFINQTLSPKINHILTTLQTLNASWGLPIPSLTYQNIYDLVSPNFIPFCQGLKVNSFLSRLPNSQILLKDYITFHGFKKEGVICTEDTRWASHASFGVWENTVIHYDPECIATRMTPAPNIGPFEGGVTILPLSFLILLLIGWFSIIF